MKSLIALLLLAISGCAKHQVNREKAMRDIMSEIPAKWMAVSSTHSLRDKEGKPEPHLFFDLDPEINRGDNKLKVVITTPKNSPYAYRVDMKSGQRYYHHSYCSQKDVWVKRNGVYDRPSFSTGYLPRVLDQLGEPQKVIVLSNDIEGIFDIDRKFFDVRLIGGYIEKYCKYGDCVFRGNWISRLVLVALDPNDIKNKSVKDITSFNKVYNWPQIQAELENIDGQNFVASEGFPINQVGGLISGSDALLYLKKYSKIFTQSEMLKISKTCHQVYNISWKDVGESNDSEKKFSQRFAQFTKKYFKEAVICDKFVYHGNLNENPEKFWFLSYLMMFYRLHNEGHYFDCKNKSWNKNVLDPEGRPSYNLIRSIDSCDDKAINLAMTYFPNYLSGQRNIMQNYYRFIDYDNHYFGTHRKLYTWSPVSPKKFDCSVDPNSEIRKELRIIPEDIEWRQREDIITEESKIIK